nr:Protein of unknown function DUF13 domain containing protein [Haemonchus contortus]
MRLNTPAFTRQLLMGLLYSIVFLLALYMYLQASTDKSNFFKASRECLLSNVDVNSDLEKMPNMDCTIVSLGIGKDVEAEKSMQAAMPNCEFWGADPVNETNADIFPEVGKFYNIAVGAENGTFRSYVLEDIYRYQEVKYVDIATFLRNYVKRPVIDQLMIDIEHAEYPMLPFLLMDGQLARDKILICQMNIEVHRPNPEQLKQFFDFFQQLMKEKQWTLMSASSIIGHLRLFMINHGSEECHKRYIGSLYQRDDLDVTDPNS